MTDAELAETLRDGRTWQAVADLCAQHGSGHPRSYWAGVAAGRFAPGWRERDALLSALGREPLGPPPSEVVAASGVAHVISACDDPDLALLVRTDGKAPKRVSVRVDGVAVGDTQKPPTLVVTHVTRNRGPSQRVTRLSEIEPPAPSRLGRGKSGNANAIAEAARRAAALLELDADGKLAEREGR